jgi:hypothetical protein
MIRTIQPSEARLLGNPAQRRTVLHESGRVAPIGTIVRSYVSSSVLGVMVAPTFKECCVHVNEWKPRPTNYIIRH